MKSMKSMKSIESVKTMKLMNHCDPTSKSKLRIVAVKGILIRLTRNFDKQRGFVNGAIAKVFEDLGSMRGRITRTRHNG